MHSAPVDAPARHAQRAHLDARRDARAGARSGAGDGDRQARVVGLVVDVAAGRAQAGGPQRRDERARGRRAQQAPAAVGEAPEAAVQHEPGAQRRRPDGAAAVDGDEERARPHEVRRDDARERMALGVRLAHEADVAHLQVAQAAVDQLGGRARGLAGEVAALHERDAQAGARSEPGDGAAHDAAADDEQVEGGAERVEDAVARVVCAADASQVTRCGGIGGRAGARTAPLRAALPAGSSRARRRCRSSRPARPMPNDATPPRPIERPIERPAAVESRVGRYSCESTIVIPKVEMMPAPANAIPARPRTPGFAR